MSSLRIYKTNLDPTRNMVVENISEYLASCQEVYVDNNFQFIRPALQQTIKINASMFYNDISLIKIANFLSITEKATDNANAEVVTYYYFIMNAEWLADGTCRLTIALDTLNTWWNDITTNLNDRTHVTRQHKDRFVKHAQNTQNLEYSFDGSFVQYTPSAYDVYVTLQDNAWVGASSASINTMTNNRSDLTGTYQRLNEVFDSDTGEYSFTLRYYGSINSNSKITISGKIRVSFPDVYLRVIDKFSEGLQPVVFGENKGTVEQDNSWYLVYLENKLEACPKTAVRIKVPGKQTYEKTDFTVNHYYYIVPDYTDSDYVYCTITTNTGSQYQAWTRGDLRNIIRFQCTSSGFRIQSGQRMKNAAVPDVAFGITWEECTSLTINAEDSVRLFDGTVATNNINTIYSLPQITKTVASSNQDIYSIDSLDRTDSKLVKIIELPYAPFAGNVADGWSYDSATHMLQANFNINLQSQIEAEFNPFQDLKVDLSNISDRDSHDANNESKLYHSDFYQPKFVYDSFSKTFALERTNADLSATILPLKINFKATNTINSRFLFDFTQYNTDGNALEDYENILVVNRNNELPIYNQAYFDYLRTGYNYDVKARNAQIGSAVGSAAVSLAGSAASIGIAATIGGSSGSVAGPIGMAVGAAVGLIGAIISISTQAQLQANSIQQKEAQYANQAMSVRGSDDVDLLNYYSGNKAKMMLYKPSNQMYEAIYNLLRLTGYACDDYTTPVFNSRIWYNYVQCEPVFSDENNTVYNNFLDDIKARFQVGVTVFHERNNYWDLEQDRENYERQLF